MVEEVLGNPEIEDFVKYFREGTKATILRRGKNKFGRFLVVEVYAAGGRIGLIMFPEGRDGRGWSRVSGELSKVVAFLGALDGSPPSVGIPVGVKLGLGTGFQTYAEVARSSASALGRRSQGQSSGSGDTAKVVVDRPAVVRCGLEALSPEDRTDRRVVEKPSS